MWRRTAPAGRRYGVASARCGALLPSCSRPSCCCPRGRPRPTSKSSLTRYMRLARQPLGRLRRQPQRRQAGVRLARRHAAHPRLQHQAVHLLGRAGPLRRRTARSAPRCWATGGSTRTASGAATSTCAAAATPPSARARSPAFYGGGATVEQLAELLDEAGIERVTGRVYGDESRHDSLRGGPDSGYGVSIWVGPLSALVLQPRPRRRGRQRLPDQPARLRGGPARRRARGARHRGAAQAARRAGRPAGSRCWPASTRRRWSASCADEQAVRQLLRRAARQGPRDAGQRPRHHRRRGRAGRRLRAPAGRSGAARGRLGPLARQPRLALPRRPPADRHGRGATSTTPCSPRCRSPAATARSTTACAAARRARTAAPRPARCRTSARCRATARRAPATSTGSRS